MSRTPPLRSEEGTALLLTVIAMLLLGVFAL